MLNVKFDKDIDINLNLKPNEILKKCKYIVDVDTDECIYKRNGPESPYVARNGDISVSLIIKIKENKGTLVTKEKIESKLYEEFNRDNIVNIEFRD
jgi:hypothetical protein